MVTELPRASGSVLHPDTLCSTFPPIVGGRGGGTARPCVVLLHGLTAQHRAFTKLAPRPPRMHKMGVRTQIMPRAALRKGTYVIVTCQRVGSTLQAITVHIQNRHPRPRRKRS